MFYQGQPVWVGETCCTVSRQLDKHRWYVVRQRDGKEFLVYDVLMKDDTTHELARLKRVLLELFEGIRIAEDLFDVQTAAEHAARQVEDNAR